MPLSRSLLCLAIALACPLTLGADPAPEQAGDPLGNLIGESHRAMNLTEEGFSGPGAALLLAEAERSTYFMIGESHGNVETPALTTWLLRSIRPFGYTTLAVEVGPITAEQMEWLADEPDAMAAFQSFNESWPFTIPFFFWKEEVAMWLDAHERGYALWGLDQEFIGSARFLLHELDGMVEDDELRPQIGTWREMATEGFRHFASSGDSSRGFLNVIDPDELAAYAERLPADAVGARRIVEELQQTAIVYQHYRDERYFLNNLDRVRLMKRHLAQYIDKAGGLDDAPKVVFKFGSVHMGRGYSPMRQLDLGNAAAELAAVRFSDSFHVNVATLASVDGEGTRKNWTESTPELGMFGKYLEAGHWGVFDLRSLRQYFASKKNREAHPDLATLVYRYDALALAPEFQAATPMIDLPF